MNEVHLQFFDLLVKDDFRLLQQLVLAGWVLQTSAKIGTLRLHSVPLTLNVRQLPFQISDLPSKFCHMAFQVLHRLIRRRLTNTVIVIVIFSVVVIVITIVILCLDWSLTSSSSLSTLSSSSSSSTSSSHCHRHNNNKHHHTHYYRRYYHYQLQQHIFIWHL